MNNIKETITALLRLTERAGIEELLEYMEDAGFYDAPCSTKYHLAEPGGLAKHSLNVFEVALPMLETLYLKQGMPLTFEEINSVVICSLLHDLGKTGQFHKPNYIANLEAASEKVEYKTNKDLLYVPHEVRNVAIASRFIQLTEQEQFAILYHNGLYGELQSVKGNETPLYMILHFADMWASRVVESEERHECSK